MGYRHYLLESSGSLYGTRERNRSLKTKDVAGDKIPTYTDLSTLVVGRGDSGSFGQTCRTVLRDVRRNKHLFVNLHFGDEHSDPSRSVSYWEKRKLVHLVEEELKKVKVSPLFGELEYGLKHDKIKEVRLRHYLIHPYTEFGLPGNHLGVSYHDSMSTVTNRSYDHKKSKVRLGTLGYRTHKTRKRYDLFCEIARNIADLEVTEAIINMHSSLPELEQTQIQQLERLVRRELVETGQSTDSFNISVRTKKGLVRLMPTTTTPSS